MALIGSMAAGVPPGYFYATGHAFPTPMVYALMGDSLTDQYRGEVEQRCPPRGMYEHHAGVAPGGGILDHDRAEGAWGENILTVDPDVVVFQSIGNYGLYPTDYTVTYGEADFYGAMNAELDFMCHTFGDEGVRLAFLLGPITAGSDPIQPQVQVLLNSIYKGLAVQYDWVTTINAYDPFGSRTRDMSLSHADGVHLNQKGETLIATLIEQWICFGAPV